MATSKPQKNVRDKIPVKRDVAGMNSIPWCNNNTSTLPNTNRIGHTDTCTT